MGLFLAMILLFSDTCQHSFSIAGQRGEHKNPVSINDIVTKIP
jgi:hypothetical protein